MLSTQTFPVVRALRRTAQPLLLGHARNRHPAEEGNEGSDVDHIHHAPPSSARRSRSTRLRLRGDAPAGSVTCCADAADTRKVTSLVSQLRGGSHGWLTPGLRPNSTHWAVGVPRGGSLSSAQ